MTNPISAAFVAEAVLLMVVFADLLTKWGVSRPSWVWFVLRSLFGSMAFALPVALLRGRDRASGEDS